MSREVHNGPTDETQARGVPFSGDPQGGAGHEEPPLQKLPLDEWHRAPVSYTHLTLPTNREV